MQIYYAQGASVTVVVTDAVVVVVVPPQKGGSPDPHVAPAFQLQLVIPNGICNKRQSFAVIPLVQLDVNVPELKQQQAPNGAGVLDVVLVVVHPQAAKPPPTRGPQVALAVKIPPNPEQLRKVVPSKQPLPTGEP